MAPFSDVSTVYFKKTLAKKKLSFAVIISGQTSLLRNVATVLDTVPQPATNCPKWLYTDGVASLDLNNHDTAGFDRCVCTHETSLPCTPTPPLRPPPTLEPSQ